MIQMMIMLALLLLAVPVLVFFTQVIFAIFNRKSASSLVIDRARPSVAILIPAHNETLVISQTLQSIMPQLGAKDQVLVVADNCSDNTADIARHLGATVAERFNKEHRGKGYALDYGLQQLKANPPEVVIIIDADCIISENAIALLAQACMQHKRPVQALYEMQSQPNPSIKALVAAFAWIVKNKVRPLGFKAIGLPCQLMGTGMAFLWQDILLVNLASGHIVEDMKLGVDLTRHNKPPLFLPEVLVTSVFPPTQAATNTQRARWEHGHLSVIVNEAPKLILESIKNKNLGMLGMALDLIVPPLAVLAMLAVAAFITCIFIHQFYAIPLALSMSGTLLMALAVGVLLAWLYFGKDIISFKQLCYAPLYALSKIPLYIKFFFNRQVEWVRSKRD
jgi:cellulose synthase/poly-beta-1,6-N-acetylglucosamine synthase-like glycosyltransferase